MFKKLFPWVLLFVGGAANAAQEDVIGVYWFPDKTGQVEIYQDDSGVFFGKVVAYDIADAKDENNPDPAKKGQPFVGSFMFENFTYNARRDRWEDGTIYDGSEGKTYKCRIWFEDGDLGTLQARGFIGAPMFGRTETFERVQAPSAD